MLVLKLKNNYSSNKAHSKTGNLTKIQSNKDIVKKTNLNNYLNYQSHNTFFINPIKKNSEYDFKKLKTKVQTHHDLKIESIDEVDNNNINKYNSPKSTVFLNNFYSKAENSTHASFNKISQFNQTKFSILQLNQISSENKILRENIELDLNYNNSQIPYEYLTDIFENLHQEELIIRPKPDYMEKIQTEINQKMRAMLVNWLVEVHFKFKLFQGTLFLCIDILDRYLSNKSIEKNKFQLLGVACLLIACKYEEIFSPEIRDFVCILDKSYEKEDIIKMEREVMKILKFDVTVPSPLKFLDILLIKYNIKNEKEINFSYYLLELTLLDYRFVKYEPSLIASTVCYIMLAHFHKNLIKNFYKTINYSEILIKECAIIICFILANINDSNYGSMMKKYSSKEMLEVTKIKLVKG